MDGTSSTSFMIAIAITNDVELVAICCDWV